MDEVSESLDSWVKFQESSGLISYIKINISQIRNTSKTGDAGVIRTPDLKGHPVVETKTRRPHSLEKVLRGLIWGREREFA